MEQIEVLKNCTVEGNIIKLPDYQIERKLYLKTKKAAHQVLNF
jgi:hypothetical protein